MRASMLAVPLAGLLFTAMVIANSEPRIAPAPATIHLFGMARILSPSRQAPLVFDFDHPPVFRTSPDFEGPWSATIQSQGKDHPLSIRHSVHAPHLLLRASLSTDLAPAKTATLTLTYDGQSVRTWRIQWMRARSGLKFIAESRVLVANQDFGAAIEHLGHRTKNHDWPALFALCELGRVHRERGSHEGAVAAWTQAELLARQLGAPTEAAGRLRALAFLDLQVGNYNSARERLSEAEVLSRSVGDQTGLARVLHYEALLMERRGAVYLPQRARTRLRNALEIAWSTGSTRDATFFATQLALLLSEHGAYEEATQVLTTYDRRSSLSPRERIDVDLYRAAVERAGLSSEAPGLSGPDLQSMLTRLLAETRASGSPRQTALALTEQVRVALILDEPATARRHLSELQLLPSSTTESDRWFLEIARIESLLDVEGPDRLEARIAAFIKSLRRTEVGEDLDYFVMAESLQGDILARQGEVESATEAYLRALEDASMLAHGFAIPRAKSAYHRQRRRALRGLVTLAVASGNHESALNYIEQDRADTLSSLARQAAAASESSAWTGYQSARLRFESTYPTGCESPGVDARYRCKTAWREVQAHLETGWAAGWSPRDGSVPSQPRLSSRLWTDEGSGTLSVFKTATGWLSVFGHNGTIETISTKGDPVEPWLGQIADLRRVYISPGASKLAFDLAWRRHGSDIVGAETEIVLVPHLLRISQSATKRGPREVLIIADPRNDLRDARDEGAWIKQRVPELTQILVGDSANRHNVLSMWQAAEVIHFAGHGRVHGSDPWQAHLELSGNTRLTLDDMIVHPTNANLVVLNGCRTGRHMYSGQVGLPQILIAGGAHYILATTSDVRDTVAREFIRRFYDAGAMHDPARAFSVVLASSDQLSGFHSFRLWGHAPK